MIHPFSHDARANRLTRWNILAITASIFLGLLIIPSRVQGKTIFDDDWVPPKSDTPVQPPAQTPPATQPVTPPESVKPETSVNTPPPLPTVAVPIHRPIPAKADQAKSRKLFKEFYAADLANRSAAGRRALATKLLDQAGAVSDAPSDQFVLLVGATEAAKEASDLALVSRAADALADAYEVDGLHVKSDAATQMVLRVDSPAATTENCRNGLELVDQLASAGDFITAIRLLKSLQAAALDAELRSQIQSKTKEVDSQKTAADRIAMFSQKLKTSPDDPVANLAVGQHLCFVKGDWARGLPLLAKGSDTVAKGLAVEELKNPNDADGQLAVADAWWAYGEGQHDPEKTAIQSHAQDYYRKILPELKGLARLKAETRLAGDPRGPSHSTVTATLPRREIGARIPAEPWVILFRSHDPSIWNTDTSRGTNDMALKTTAAPEEAKWLRLTCAANGKSVIIPITKEALSQQSLVSDEFGWDGTATFALGATHLGIWSEKLILDRRGVVAVGRAGHDRRGWGFGRHHQVNKGQGYSWEGEELRGPVVFEIAVKAGILMDAEQKTQLGTQTGTLPNAINLSSFPLVFQ
jgi:hypothetical protein